MTAGAPVWKPWVICQRKATTVPWTDVSNIYYYTIPTLITYLQKYINVIKIILNMKLYSLPLIKKPLKYSNMNVSLLQF